MGYSPWGKKESDTISLYNDFTTTMTCGWKEERRGRIHRYCDVRGARNEKGTFKTEQGP